MSRFGVVESSTQESKGGTNEVRDFVSLLEWID